jgi:hypothetical protein
MATIVSSGENMPLAVARRATPVAGTLPPRSQVTVSAGPK